MAYGLSLWGEGDPGGHGAPLGERDDLDLLLGGVVGGDAGEGGTEIDTNNGLIIFVCCE